MRRPGCGNREGATSGPASKRGGPPLALNKSPRLAPHRNIDLADPARPVRGEPLISFSSVGVPAGRDGLYVVATVTGVWTSTDAGVTWRQSRRGLEEVALSVDPLRAPIPEAELQRGFGIDAVAIDPGAPHRLFAGTMLGPRAYAHSPPTSLSATTHSGR
jgi:hypothetical protein